MIYGKTQLLKQLNEASELILFDIDGTLIDPGAAGRRVNITVSTTGGALRSTERGMPSLMRFERGSWRNQLSAKAAERSMKESTGTMTTTPNPWRSGGSVRNITPLCMNWRVVNEDPSEKKEVH